jgi:hypothetical protein
VRDYTRLLKRHFAFGKKPVNEITPQESNRRIDRLQKTVSEQNHALVAIKVFFRWAQRRHYVEHSPCEGMQAGAQASLGHRRLRLSAPTADNKYALPKTTGRAIAMCGY